jgi:hypothetical protein
MGDTTAEARRTATGTYLYAVTARPEAGAGNGAGAVPGTGVLGTELRAIALDDLVAYVSTVPLAEFGEEALRRNLEDLAWLETVARAHHEVLEALMPAGPVLPVRLVTVYRGDEQVRDMLRERASEFGDLLDRMRGRREWGVKVYAVGEAGSGPEARSSAAGDQGAGETAGETAGRPGTAYLKRRGQTLRSREQKWRQAVARAEHVDTVLSRIAVATRHHRAQDPQLSGRTDMMVLNGAYLVDDGRADEFAAAAAGLREGELDVQLTGPWPPYSFTISDEAGDRAAAGRPAGRPGGVP